MVSVIAHVRVGDVDNLRGLDVHHREPGCRVAFECLSPNAGGGKRAIVRHHAPVLLHHAQASRTHAHGFRRPPVERQAIQRRAIGVGPAVARNDDSLAIGSPIQRLIVTGVEGKLTRLAAGRGNHIHVVVAGAIAGECDPLPIRREAWGEVIGNVCRQTVAVGPVGIGHPNVIVIGERDAPVVGNVRQMRELDRHGTFLPAPAHNHKQKRNQQNDFEFCLIHNNPPWRLPKRCPFGLSLIAGRIRRLPHKENPFLPGIEQMPRSRPKSATAKYTKHTKKGFRVFRTTYPQILAIQAKEAKDQRRGRGEKSCRGKDPLQPLRPLR